MNRYILVGGPRRGKSTTARALRAKSIPTYCTDPRSLCKEPEDGVTYLPEFYAQKERWSDASKFIADQWFAMPGPWCIDGVATARALRKWGLERDWAHMPCDRIIVFAKAHPLAKVSEGQENMAKAVMTVWREIAHRYEAITEYR